MPRNSLDGPRSVTHLLPGGGTTLQQWVKECRKATSLTSTLYSGCRKILRPYHFQFTSLDDSLHLIDAGFTISKLRMLERNYVHEESIAAAKHLWQRRVGQGKYGSVGFTTYSHFIKSGGLRNPWELASKVTGREPRPGGTMGGRGKSPLPPAKVNRSSVMGPCIQSVTLTLLDKNVYAIDVFYRTTELYKKFAPDIVFLRDVLLEPFNLNELTLQCVTFHFANVTVHPMYWVTIVPHLSDPVAELKSVDDQYFRRWLIKWTARYICEEFEHGIAKFAQALRVKQDALKRIDKKKLNALQTYLRKNHPGYTRTRFEEDTEDDEQS